MMKFVADVMLGRLAKHLRLLGFDVLYDPAMDDNEIIRLSLEQDRTILTRDRRLSNRPLSFRHIFISSEKAAEQLQQVLDAVERGHLVCALTRCSVCNTPITRISREDAEDLVPEHVLTAYREFTKCGRCGRIYWMGSHIQKFLRKARPAEYEKD